MTIKTRHDHPCASLIQGSHTSRMIVLHYQSVTVRRLSDYATFIAVAIYKNFNGHIKFLVSSYEYRYR
jgi:hypothetical protein